MLDKKRSSPPVAQKVNPKINLLHVIKNLTMVNRKKQSFEYFNLDATSLWNFVSNSKKKKDTKAVTENPKFSHKQEREREKRNGIGIWK